MDNPFLIPAPADPIQRIHDFARDVAYGAAIGEWDARINANSPENWFRDHIGGYEEWPDNRRHFYEKWQLPGFSRHSTFLMLVSFGYTTRETGTATVHNIIPVHYALTEKAFALLEHPIQPLKVFVSYRRRQSSALTLLVEARLKLADSGMDIFVDKDIPVGNDWEDELKERVRTCDYFIALIGPQTLTSPNVLDELEWAAAANRRIVLMLHPGFKLDDASGDDPRLPAIVDDLRRRQLIQIVSESAEHYDAAIRKLINALGYSTL